MSRNNPLKPFICFRLAKFGWVTFADLRVQRLTAKQNTEVMEGARELRSCFHPFVNRKVDEILGRF